MKGALPPAASTAPQSLQRTFWALLLPMIFANFLQSLTGTLSGVFVGHMLGAQALAAISGMFPVVFFCVAFVIGLGAGASVLVGQAWGAREHERLRAVAGTALVAALGFGLVVLVVGLVAAESLMRVLGTPADVFAQATRYTRTMALAMPGLFVFILFTSLLRGVGDSVSPLMALCASTLVSCVLTPALIGGWGGLPALGVAAPAVSMTVSYVAALVLLAWRLRVARYHGQRHPLRPDRVLVSTLRLSLPVLKAVLRIGVPTAVQMLVVALSELAILRLVNGHGSQATAAYGAVNNIINYVQFPAISVAICCSVLGAQAIGAGRHAHATRGLMAIVRTGIQVNLIATGALVLLGYVFSAHIVGLFTTDAAVIDLARNLLRVMLWSLLVFGTTGALTGVMRSSGSVLVPTLISIGSILVVQLPVAHWLDAHWGLQGVWYAYPAVFVAALALQGAYFQWFWRRRPIRRLV